MQAAARLNPLAKGGKTRQPMRGLMNWLIWGVPYAATGTSNVAFEDIRRNCPELGPHRGAVELKT